MDGNISSLTLGALVHVSELRALLNVVRSVVVPEIDGEYQIQVNAKLIAKSLMHLTKPILTDTDNK